MLFCISLKERQSSTELRIRLGVDAIGDVMRRGRLGWHEHMERMDDADIVNVCTRLVVDRTAPVGRRRKIWQETVSTDMCLLKVDPGTFPAKTKGGP